MTKTKTKPPMTGPTTTTTTQQQQQHDGCFCLTVPTYGLLSAIGLFQTYWHAGLLAGHSEADVAWITSVFGFLDCLFAAPVGVLLDHCGTRWLLPLGCAAYVAAFAGLAFCDSYARFMACMAVAGVAAASPTTIAFSVVGQWFTSWKGLATGCVTLGAPLGGIFFSLVLQTLFANLPWRTAALVLTAIMAALMAVGCVLVENKVPREEREDGGDEDEAAEPPAKVSHVLTSPKFWLISYAIFAYELVLFTQWGSIPSYAVAAHVRDKQFYLTMSGAVLGRTLPPWLGDRVLGPLNATIAMNLFTLLVVLAIWIPVGTSSLAALFIVVALMGVGTGSFVPLGVSCINALCSPQHTGTWLGLAYGMVSFAILVGNPASAVILARYDSNGLLAFLAAVLFSGMISAAALRWLVLGRRWSWKVGRV
ncbi:hypothetical protein C8A05DRAFT_35936 [Staphylotrichum tortipilum]|uniref:Major facilitator superfamily (MFS) profile domain-containing protein n=1 Tax=Staphylotrichum tortipilum TaxID=2831512 RepID=A0AAN6MHR2_9PEZI|nr:hypothetical protein C8A05DRAFT_35936 [Staphylotrichum longicolle]